MFRVGDEVMFKTGKGPIMVVTRIDYPKPGWVLCKWWDEKAGRFTRQTFQEGELEHHGEKGEE